MQDTEPVALREPPPTPPSPPLDPLGMATRVPEGLDVGATAVPETQPTVRVPPIHERVGCLFEARAEEEGVLGWD